ncbi:MAG: hypothetical protein ABIO46_14450 [Chitinophagales bacterium]
MFLKNIFSLFILCLLTSKKEAQNCAPASAFDFLDINNVKTRINNGGDMWWDLIQDAEYVVPKNRNASSLFSGSLWIGGNFLCSKNNSVRLFRKNSYQQKN